MWGSLSSGLNESLLFCRQIHEMGCTSDSLSLSLLFCLWCASNQSHSLSLMKIYCYCPLAPSSKFGNPGRHLKVKDQSDFQNIRRFPLTSGMHWHHSMYMDLLILRLIHIFFQMLALLRTYDPSHLTHSCNSISHIVIIVNPLSVQVNPQICNL